VFGTRLRRRENSQGGWVREVVTGPPVKKLNGNVLYRKHQPFNLILVTTS